MVGSHVGRGEDVGEKEHLLVRQILRHLQMGHVGIGDAQILRLPAREAAGDMRVAEEPGGGVAELLRLHLAVGVGALAEAPVAPLALPAGAAADGEGHHDPVADLQRRVLLADLDHLAHAFMAEHVALLHGRDITAHQVEVGAADGAGRHLDDGIAPVLDLRIGHGLAADGAAALPGECLHDRFFPNDVDRPETFRGGALLRTARSSHS